MPPSYERGDPLGDTGYNFGVGGLELRVLICLDAQDLRKPSDSHELQKSRQQSIVQDTGFEVSGLGIRLSRFRVQDLGIRV